MSASVQAAVLRAAHTPLATERLELADPGPGEVRVRYGASGVCHSDLHCIDGEWSVPLPLVLGHEGAGTVEAVGAGVTGLAPGDTAVLSWRYACGHCRACLRGRSWACSETRMGDCTLDDGTLRFRDGAGTSVYQYLSVGTFAEAAVVPASAVVPIPASVPFEVACLIGCSVTTGVGAVVNTARVEPGASLAVIGCGGVGLSVVMGAALAGAHPIIAIDVEDAKLDQARELGATHAVRGDAGVAAAVRAIVAGGVDYAFEAIGLQRTVELLPDLLCLGGVAVMVGMTAEDTQVRFSGFGLVEFGHSVLGSNYGSSVAPIDFPRIAALYEAGKLPIDRMITRRVALDEVNEAFDDMRARRGGRAVVVYD
ncbi:MAG: S-(hydroxymethyl)glutathione dehydrogenase / alcohol dehydrogenase [Gaiellales bacterium]|jgi:S-(hydroxymethyl)glutathione dehydrogenase/alcohol dehydrogenase|nr:S-(hydroxymethyl)glutathione dehydrogenase / alcohol dehydrogenase [Gaiellales bacterium]